MLSYRSPTTVDNESNNFRSSKHANNLIKTDFIYFTLLMRENGMIEDDALFVDGTKLEADANLYSFT